MKDICEFFSLVTLSRDFQFSSAYSASQLGLWHPVLNGELTECFLFSLVRFVWLTQKCHGVTSDSAKYLVIDCVKVNYTIQIT